MSVSEYAIYYYIMALGVCIFLKIACIFVLLCDVILTGYGSRCWSCVHPIYHYLFPLEIRRTTGADFVVKLTTELLPRLLLATFQERFLPA